MLIFWSTMKILPVYFALLLFIDHKLLGGSIARCKQNEEFTKCGYHDCFSTCSEPDRPMFCIIPECSPGCVCKKGYIKNDQGDCIPLGNCSCPVNQVFSECGRNNCQNSCMEPTNSASCNEPCTAGCVCMEGYLKNVKGTCVPTDECDKCLDLHKEFRKCGSACPKTCETIEENVIICSKICVPGCFCKNNYVLYRDDCILPQDCPKQ